MKHTLLLLAMMLGCNFFCDAQIFFKPNGCAASTGPNVSTIVLQHEQSRYHLITVKWSDIETAPGVFTFNALQNQINTVKSYNKKYALALISGGTGSPDWLINNLNAPYLDYLFQGSIPYKLPLWWDNIVQQRISIMVSVLGNQFAGDTSLALVYVTQMTANGIEGHLNGINMPAMYSKGFSRTNWINAAKQTTYYYTDAFPDKAIAFEVHDIDTSATVPATIIHDLYNDSTLCKRVGAALWWLSGKTSYQSSLLTVLQNFQGDKYAQLIAKSSQPERFKDSLISTAFVQAKALGVRYVEPWLYEYQNNTIDSLLLDFNTWSDLHFARYDTCQALTTGSNNAVAKKGISIYPNPAEKVLIINNLEGDNNQVQIFDATGRVIKDLELSPTRQIDISGLNDGIYFLRFKNYPLQAIKFLKI